MQSRKLENVWWSELADWYEDYAEHGDLTKFTCPQLRYAEQLGLVENWCWTDELHMLFKYWPDELRMLFEYWPHASKVHQHYPCHNFCPEFDSEEDKRKALCLWMAETIREYLEDGTMPWEAVE